MPGVPERTCVGCRRTAAREVLVRLVRGADGVEVDPSRSAAGRGAHVHPRLECIDAACRRGVLARALRTALHEHELSKLKRDLRERVGAT